MSDNIIKTYRISKNHFTPTNPEVEKQIIENSKAPPLIVRIG